LFCELILARLGVLQISKECPLDIKEAVCTIIYAAPRAEVKELNAIREMLIIKFGRELATCAVHNKDNCVNARIVHKLSIQTPENYLVFQYLNEIAKSYNLEWKADFAIEPVQLETPTVLQTPQTMFPDPPRTMFPDPPKSISSIPNNVPDSSFPSFPQNSIPTFNPNAMPGGNYANVTNYANVPSFLNEGNIQPNSKNTTEFPTPPTGGTFKEFPSPPTGGTFKEFPSPPTGGSFTEFPSPPGSKDRNNTEVSNFSTQLDFPSPPSNDAGSNSSVPDFDELTARFEKLKKRDT